MNYWRTLIVVAAFLLAGFSRADASGVPDSMEDQAEAPLVLPSTNDANWVLQESVRFELWQDLDACTYYAFNLDTFPAYHQGCVLPKNMLQINSSEVNDCYIELAGRIPHRVKWVIEVNIASNGMTLTPEADGVVFQYDRKTPGIAINPGWHVVSMEREGDKLTARVDSTDEAVTFVAPSTQVPLRLTVRRKPFVSVRRSLVFSGAGQSWEPAARPQQLSPPTNVIWKEVYHQSFDTIDSLKDFKCETSNGVAQWFDDGCLHMAADIEGRPENVIMTLQRELPGDIRVSFRARNIPPESHFFGIMLSCKGEARREDGYFCEWNRNWMRRIKKRDVQKNIVHPYEQEDVTRRWRNYRAERIGPKITMFTDGKETLSWVDPDPVTGPEFNRMAFYVWRHQNDFDDLVIEQNAGQATQPLRTACMQTNNLPKSTTAANLSMASDTVIVRQSPSADAQPAEPLRLELTNLQTSSDTISFHWVVQAGYEYDVETCNSLGETPQWTPVPGWAAVRPAGADIVFNTTASTNGHSFYRVVTRRIK